MFSFGKLTIICWIVFWLYWLISAFGSKRNISLNASNAKQFFGIRIVILAAAVIVINLFDKGSYSFQDHYLIAHNEVVSALGFVVFMLGLALAIWARLHLGKNWGMPMTLKKEPELVTSGPYHYIRHPIYSGILLAALGSAFSGSFYWLFYFVIIAVYFIYCALVEEKNMARLFPKTYPAYKSKTKMLIPFTF